MNSLFVQDISIESLLEPLDSVLFVGLVVVSNLSSASLSLSNSGTGSTHDNVEVHTVNTNGWVVLYTQIDVLLNTETEVTSLRKVLLSQLIGIP